MRADAARADRRHAVRTAAHDWHHAGAIDDVTLHSIEAAYPDDRVRLGVGLRILAAVGTLVGGGALGGLAASFLRLDESSAILWVLLAASFAMATEVQVGRLRRAQAGAEYATALLSVIYACMGVTVAVDEQRFTMTCAGFCITLALAAWRWAYASFAALAAVFVLVAWMEHAAGQFVWLVLGLLAAPAIVVAGRRSTWPPALRRCVEAAALVLLAGAYAATNIYLVDHSFYGFYWHVSPPAVSASARGLAIAGTALMPLVIFAMGVRFRRRSLLALGVLLVAASLVTLRRYHPIGPWWFSLMVGGSACLVLAVGVRRWLESGPDRERHGFTAEPLFDDRRLLQAARTVATIAAMSPAVRVAAERPFEGGGGKSAGGGATGTE